MFVYNYNRNNKKINEVEMVEWAIKFKAINMVVCRNIYRLENTNSILGYCLRNTKHDMGE